MSSHRNTLWSRLFRAAVPALAFGASASSVAGPSENAAARLYTRLASHAPTRAQLTQMASLIEQNRWMEAAAIPMEQPDFYSVTLKNWVTPWTNVDRVVTRPLNDMSATIIGVIRDENKPNAVTFDELLSADVLYTSAAGYARNNNDAYAALEANRSNLKDEAVLVKTTQSAAYAGAISTSGIAGVMSTRQWANEYYMAGTNRRSFRFMAINFMCRDFEQMFDTSISDEYVTRDVDRAPGGDPQLYLRRCIGCHAGFNDPFRKAFAYYDFGDVGNGNGLRYTPGAVPGKINDNNRRAVFVDYENATVANDEWVNLITVGVNKGIGWNPPKEGSHLSGNGAAQLGRTIAATDAFSKCIARRAFEHVCIRKPTVEEDNTLNGAIAKGFKESDYKVRPLFANVSALCLK